MSIAAEVNAEIRRRFEQFRKYGAPGRYINLPRGFRAETNPEGEIVLVHNDCPIYPVRIGRAEFAPYRWTLGLNWEQASRILVRLLDLEPAEVNEEVPF